MQNTILIIEDDTAILDMITLALENEGYLTNTASTLGEALAQLSNETIALILCDSLTTTIDDRYATLNQIKANTTKPIIIVTAHTPDYYMDHKELGFAGALFKPFDLDQLLDLVLTFLPL